MSELDDRVIPLDTVYRIVWTDPPTHEDFKSNTERGVEPRRPLPEEFRRLESGISVFRTAAQARRTARKRPPWLGQGHIAKVVIPARATVTIERTTRSAGHYTMWVSAEDALSWVAGVEPVTPSE